MLSLEKVSKPLRLLERVEVPIPRPPTPTADHPDLEEEKKELAIILLQQILRGRAIQTKVGRLSHDVKLS